jgi:hypothetical protein
MKISRKQLERLIEQVIDEQNPHHSKSGKFSSEKNSTCDSEWFSKKKRKRIDGELTDKKDTGRGKRPNKGTGKYRCYDNSPKWEGLIREIEIDEGIGEGELKKRCEDIGLLSFKGFLSLLDKLERAQKGALNKGGD